MKTTAQHTLILKDGKSHPASSRAEMASPLSVALAAVSDYGQPGVDLDIYLAAVDAGRSHADALAAAKAPLLPSMG